MRPVILVDFDDVLISTAELKEDLFAVAEEQGVSHEAALLAYTKVRTWPFTLEKFAEALWDDAASAKQAKKAFDQLFKKPRQYNYPGVEKFLDILKGECELILLTFGVPKFQKAKIKQSGLGNYFKKTIFTDDPAKEKALRTLRRQHKGALILMDDSLTAVAAAEEAGIPAIRIAKSAKGQAYYASLLKRIAALIERQEKKD